MSRERGNEKNALEYPELSIVFSDGLANQPWFGELSVKMGEAKLSGISIQTTFPEQICWKSTSEDFVDDQVALIVDLKEFTSIVQNLDQEIAAWPGKFGRKFVTIIVMLQNRQKISAELDRRVIEAQLDCLFNVYSVHGVRELFDLLSCMTKAVAKKFSSRLREEVLGFEENRRTAANPTDVWPNVLETFFNVAAAPLAKAIAARYPSPRALRQELLRRPVTEVFEGITATVGQPPLQKTFRIGPETANRLYNFFTQNDPNTFI